MKNFRAQFQSEQLHRAAAAGDLIRAGELLDAKYPVNRFDDIQKTPLHYAVAGEHLDMVDLLLRAGANVNAQLQPSDTPLGEYAGSCSYEMARKLIDDGADPTIPGWMMLTALHRAQDRKRDEGKQVLRLLQDAAKRQSSRKS